MNEHFSYDQVIKYIYYSISNFYESILLNMSLEKYKDSAPFLSSIILSISLLITALAFLVARNALKTNQMTHVYSRMLEHNRSICDDIYRQIAINVFLNLENEYLKPTREAIEKTEDGYHKPYWATRAIHLSHALVFAQVWIISKEKKKIFIRKHPGWAKTFAHVAKEIDKEKIGDSGKPKWYIRAILDLYFADTESIVGSKFDEFIKDLGSNRL